MMAECEKCTEHSGVVVKLATHRNLIEKIDRRFWQLSILLIGILITSMITAGSTAYFAMSRNVSTLQSTQYQERMPRVTRVTPMTVRRTNGQ